MGPQGQGELPCWRKNFWLLPYWAFSARAPRWPTTVIAAAAAVTRTGTTGTPPPSYAPAVVSARVVDVDPLVRHVTVDRPREQCWNEIVREPVRPFGVVGQTAAGSIVGAAIGRQFGSGNDRDTLTVLGAIAGGAVAHRRAVVNAGLCDARRLRAALRGRQRPRHGRDRRRLSRDVSARRPQLHDADRSAPRRLRAARCATRGLSAGAVLRALYRAGPSARPVFIRVLP